MNTPASFDLPALARICRANGIDASDALTLSRSPAVSRTRHSGWRGADRPLVVRKKPDGQLLASAHAIDREFRVMKALRDTDVPVPQIYFYCDDPSILGTPFYVMEISGWANLRGPIAAGLGPEGPRRALCRNGRVIAALHRVDYVSVALGDFGRPGNYVGRQIARWTKGYREAETVAIPAMDALIDWLPRHVPDVETTSLVHGDFRLDNLIFDAHEPRVIGVIDWELATARQPARRFRLPLHELAYSAGCLARDRRAGSYRTRHPLRGGLCRVLRQSREPCHDPAWDFYLAYNFFRIAAILQGIAKRAEDGTPRRRTPWNRTQGADRWPRSAGSSQDDTPNDRPHRGNDHD